MGVAGSHLEPRRWPWTACIDPCEPWTQRPALGLALISLASSPRLTQDHNDSISSFGAWVTALISGLTQDHRDSRTPASCMRYWPREIWNQSPPVRFACVTLVVNHKEPLGSTINATPSTPRQIHLALTSNGEKNSSSHYCRPLDLTTSTGLTTSTTSWLLNSRWKCWLRYLQRLSQ